jgi:hypothetical protein
MLQADIDDLDVSYKVSPVDPEGYVLVASHPDSSPFLEIFPVEETGAPLMDDLYEALAGPYFTYDNFKAIESWGKVQKVDTDVQDTMIAKLAAVRYDREITGCTALVQGVTVPVDTRRETRNVFVQQYFLMSDTDTVTWKFPDCWLVLTKADLGICVNAGVTHIQTTFTWERDTAATIRATTGGAALRALYNLLFPLQN